MSTEDRDLMDKKVNEARHNLMVNMPETEKIYISS